MFHEPVPIILHTLLVESQAAKKAASKRCNLMYSSSQNLMKILKRKTVFYGSHIAQNWVFGQILPKMPDYTFYFL